MKPITVLFSFLLLITSLSLKAQDNTTDLQHQIKELNDEKDPARGLMMMKNIIRANGLAEPKDNETIDVIKGSTALIYIKAGKPADFLNMIATLRNKFNQTSYMSMAAAMLIESKTDLASAELIAKKTLDLYLSYKDDPKARPAEFEAADWKRFMDFAQYVYNDTYAEALFANGKYKEALAYQEKAFPDGPENGMQNSIERYAKLLALDNQENKAYALVLKMAETGKSTIGMTDLLKKLYAKRNPGKSADEFIAGLQKNLGGTVKAEVQKTMLNVEAPAFTLRDTNGKTVSLADFKGKIVVIDFWATWCAPCKASFPAMAKMVAKHPDVKFLFIATQEQQPDALKRVKDYIKQNNYPFHVLMDQPLKSNPKLFQVLAAYKVTGIPTKVIIDAEGRQRFFSVGFKSDTELMNDLNAMIELASEQSK